MLENLIPLLKSFLDGGLKDLPWQLQAAAFLILIAVLYHFWRFHRLQYRHLYDSRKVQINKLNDYLGENCIHDPDLKQILAQERDDQIFAHVYGYSLSKKKRDLLTPIVKSETERIYWSNLKDSDRFIKAEGGALSVTYSRFDMVDYRVNHIIAFTIVVLMVILMMISLFSPNSTLLQKIIMTPVIGTMGFIPIQLMKSTLGLKVALRLEKWLKKNRQNS